MGTFHDITEFLSAGKTALDLAKGLIGLVPKGKDQDAFQEKIRAAEDALRRCDVKLANDLGMKLCDCTMPPQIMLWKEKENAHVCPNAECGRKIELRPTTIPAWR